MAKRNTINNNNRVNHTNRCTAEKLDKKCKKCGNNKFIVYNNSNRKKCSKCGSDY